MSDLQWQILDLAIGSALWALSLAVPFRSLNTRPDVRWDVIGIVSGIAFAFGADALLESVFDWELIAQWLAGWYALVASLPVWLAGVAYVVLADLGAYVAHRSMHTRAVWPVHAWHHSSKYLYWVAGVRGSPLDTLILFVPYFAAYALIPIPEAAAAGVITALISIANQHYIHSNIRVPYPKWLEYVFVTPRFHFVHHSRDMKWGNSNYGFVFSVWDRMFGTYTDPEKVPADTPLGLDYAAENWRLLMGLPAKQGQPASAADSTSP